MLEGLVAIIAVLGTLVFIALIWELIWKGIALWYSARDGHKIWYLCILVFNTLGILPIVYLLIHRNKDVNKMYKRIISHKKRR